MLRITPRLVAGLLILALALTERSLQVRAADYFATHSREYKLRGTTAVRVTDAAVKKYGAAKAIERALEADSRYYNLIHFISAYFMAHKLDSFARGYSFKTESFEKGADGQYRVTFVGEIGGRLDLMEKMERKGLFRSGDRFLVPTPADVEGMSEHDWYEFKAESFSGEMVQVPVSIAAEAIAPDAYPDFARLFEDGELTISIFYGFDGGDDEFPGGEDLTVAKQFYETITQEARRLQFSDPVDEHFGRIKNSTTFTRTLIVDSGSGPREVAVKLKLFYRKSPKVKYHFRKELKTADVVIYDGHSSYGGGFSLSSSLFFANPEDTEQLDREMKAEQTPEKYQIYFMNACHTYGYYPDMFLELLSKKDTSNLDIVTTINAASFADSVKTDAKLVNLLTALVPRTTKPLHRPRSWSEIVGSLNAGLTSPTYYAVHGISDNPRTAYGRGRAPLELARPRTGANTALTLDLPSVASLLPGSVTQGSTGLPAFFRSVAGGRGWRNVQP